MEKDNQPLSERQLVAVDDSERVKLTWKQSATFDQQREIYKMLGFYVVTPGFKQDL